MTALRSGGEPTPRADSAVALVERTLERMRRLQDVLGELSLALNAPRVAEIVIEHGIRSLDGRSGALYRVGPESLELVHATNFPAVALERFARVALDAPIPVAVVARTGEPVYLQRREDLARLYPEHEASLRDFNTVPSLAVAALPLRVRGELVATMAISFDDGRILDDDERAFLQVLAQHCAQALDRVQLFEAERAARMAQERTSAMLEAVIAASPAAILLLDEQGRVGLWNPAAERIYGWSAAEVLGRELPSISPHMRDEFRANLARLAAGETLAFETRRSTARGEIDVAIWAAPVRGPDGTRQTLSLVVDVSERRRKERIDAFLARASAELSVSLDLDEIVSRLVELPVPGFAEAVHLDLVDREGRSVRFSSRPRGPPVEPPPGARAVRAPLVARGVTFGELALLGRGPGDSMDVWLARELASRAALAIENARLFREVTEAVRARDEFLSIAGHELRTPLTTLRVQVESLRRNDGKLEERSRIIGRQVDRLARLVGELLDVTRLASGGIRLDTEPMDLRELVQEVLERSGDEIARSGCQVTCDLEPAPGHWDRARLDQVVTNLLSNALKYGERRPVHVSLRAEDGRTRLVVRDQGIGIDPDHQARIFERFERAVSSRNFGGLGLGLWIVRQVVEGMNGTVSVESAPGRGSSFTVELPAADPGKLRRSGTSR